MNFTFHSEQEYLKFLHTILIFTHLRAYNAGCSIWKKEDEKDIRKIDAYKGSKGSKADRPKDFSKWVDTYFRAEKEYGKVVYNWKELFGDCEPNNLLESLGLKPSYNNEANYILEDLDADLSKYEKTEDYPKSFPVIVSVIAFSDDMWTNFIYPEDFNKPLDLPDFSWLEDNVREFWGGKQEV